MHEEIVTRWVMTKFTQIPQSSEELRICFKKDTRRNGIMTSLLIFNERAPSQVKNDLRANI